MHGKTGIKIYIKAIEKIFKKMKHKKIKSNCISKLFPKPLFFINLQKRKKIKEQGNDICCFQNVNLNVNVEALTSE